MEAFWNGIVRLDTLAARDRTHNTRANIFRNATIDKWYQRTKLASGKTSKGYTALEQPPVKQIEHILEDRDRLVERTRIKRSSYKIIGVSEPEKKVNKLDIMSLISMTPYALL